MGGQSCLDIELGLTIATLRLLLELGLPDPTSWTYAPASRVEIGGDGRSRGFGFATASLNWEVLDQQQLNNGILEFFANESDMSVELYAWLYTDSGSGTGDMRARFQCIMHRPTDGQGKSFWPDTRSPVYQDVTVQFTRLESA